MRMQRAYGSEREGASRILTIRSRNKRRTVLSARLEIVAAETAILSNFLLNDASTFGHAARRQRGLRTKLRRFLGFNAICTAGLALNVVILNVLFNFAHLNRYLANGIAILAVTAWNYWLNMPVPATEPVTIGTTSSDPSRGYPRPRALSTEIRSLWGVLDPAREACARQHKGNRVLLGTTTADLT
jgi:hypothetical protein